MLEKFPETLDELISDNLTTLTEVSADLNCGESTLSRYTNGTALPTLEMTVKLANYFGVTCDYLLGLDTDYYSGKFTTRCPSFKRRFKAVLKEFKISRYKLTQMTGIAESVMRYWIQGKTEPSITNVVKIAQALGCTVDYLIGRRV